MTNQKGDLLERWRALEFSGDCREMIAFTINKLLQRQYDNQQFIFESAHASYDIQHFESLVEKYHMSDLSIIHLVHDDYSVDQLLGKIRDNDDVADWTYHKSNDELRYKLNFALRANKNFRDYLILNDKQFFATSIQREATFNRICNSVLEGVY
ncbi:hypothetical protein GIX45_16945 [Erwinia sp. CPCC 100877]|nr:hypothetical protein [Erwinia sp. CPCC 100877]